MTEKSLIEANNEMAKFSGVPYIKGEDVYWFDCWLPFISRGDYKEWATPMTKEMEYQSILGEQETFTVLATGFLLSSVHLLYNTSWDWFVPVAKKAKDYLQMMERPNTNACCKGDLIEVDIQCHIWEMDLPKAHESLSELITWIKEYENSRNVSNVPGTATPEDNLPSGKSPHDDSLG